MRTIKLLSFLSIFLTGIQSCADKPTPALGKPVVSSDPCTAKNTKTCQEDKPIISAFEFNCLLDCPDSTDFHPIDLKAWDKTPAVSGRSYHMKLPRLAYCINPHIMPNYVMDSTTGKLKQKPKVVVVIQLTRRNNDTLAGFRYLTGGCGGSLFHDLHFLTDDEIKNAVGL